MTVELAVMPPLPVTPALRARQHTLRDPGGLLVDLLSALDVADTCEAFAGAAAVGAARIIECSAATFDLADAPTSSHLCASTDARLETPEAIAARLLWAQAGPLAPHGAFVPDSPPLTISCVVTRQAFRASEPYRAFYGPQGIEDQLVICTAGVVLRLDRADWDFSEQELAQAREIQRILRVMTAVHREREARRVGASVAMDLVEKSGRAVMVRDRAGTLRDLEGAPVELAEPLASAVDSAVAVALLSAPKEDDGQSLVEITVPTERGAHLSVRVLPPPAPGSLLAVVVERAPVGPGLDDLLRHNLTARQAEVMEMILGGSTNGGVAHRLGISERTVEKHVIAAYVKLGARTRTEALLKVLR